MKVFLRLAVATIGVALSCVPAFADLSGDAAFGNNGLAFVNFTSNLDSARDVAVQTGGKVVLVGLSRQASGADTFDYVGIARLDANGAPDATFGEAGTLALLPGGTPLNFGGGDGRAVVVQPADQKIVIAGSWNVNDGSGRKVFVLRLTADGDPDPTFAGGNAVLLDVPSLIDPLAEAVALQSDRGIIVSGGANNPSIQKGFVLRVTNAGALDASFGAAGVFAMNSPVGSGLPLNFNGLAVLDDDSIVAAGGPNDLVVLKLTSAGQPDTGFDEDGVVSFNLGTVDIGGGIFVDTNEDTYGVAAQADGRIVIAGVTQPDPTNPANSALVARLTAGGALDASFGTDGYTFLPGITTEATPYDVVVRPDGDLVVAGLSIKPTQVSENGKAVSALSGTFTPQSINGLVALPDGRVVGGGEQNALGLDYVFVALRLTATALAEPECPPLGELNGDCDITATDALIGLKMAVGVIAEDPAADMDCNGDVAASDALKILRVAVGVDEPPPACG